MSASKKTGFLTALILAIVSFFLIYLFFPAYAQKYLTVTFDKNSIDTEKINEAVTKAISDIDISSLIGTPSGN